MPTPRADTLHAAAFPLHTAALFSAAKAAVSRLGAILTLSCAPLGCGNEDGGARNGATATNDPSAATDAAMPEPTGPVATPQFGFVAVEPIEEDGSSTGVGVEPTLVERYDELRNALPMLARAKVSIALMLQAHKIMSPSEMNEVFSLIEQASGAGLEVRPVPVLSADQGYFPNATNVETFVPVVRSLVAQYQARGLPPTTLVVDMEPPRDLIDALGSLDLGKAVPKDHIDRARHGRGVAAYAALADELHRAGWKVAVTTQASLLADYRDDDDDLRQYFNVVLEGVAWDQVDFQLYRSAYSSQAPGLGAHFVYDFARTAKQRFPASAVGVGIGLTHPGPVFPETSTLSSSDALAGDVAAAVAAGIAREHITVYNLKGILLGPPKCDKVLPCKDSELRYEANDPAAWFVPAGSTQAPSEDASTKLLWEQLDLMDALLDASEDSQAGGLL
jgi:hypothetical protein